MIEMIFIPEGDVYRLSARSKLQGADKFESWIFDEVVPTVMKTGSYSVSSVEVPIKSIPEISPNVISRLLETMADHIKMAGGSANDIIASDKHFLDVYGIPVPEVLIRLHAPEQTSLFADMEKVVAQA